MRLTKSHLPADLQPYLKRLNSLHKKRREEALAAARQLSSDQLLTLATAATRQIEGIRRRVWIGNPFLWIMLIMPAVYMLLWHLHRATLSGTDRMGSVILSLVIGFPYAMLLYGFLTEPTRLYIALRTLIADREDACLLGPALDLQLWGELPMTGYVNMPLQNLLPAIERMLQRREPGDYADLTALQKERLLRWLKAPLDHPGLALALLETLKTVSDKIARDRVAQLAHEEAVTPRQKQFREAARQCLVAMQREHAREQQAHLLLRASEASPVATPDLLLRPAVDTNAASAPDQLLRATDSRAPYEASGHLRSTP